MKNETKGVRTFSNGVRVINCTPHDIKFRELDGSVIKVEPSGYLLNAEPIEEIISKGEGYEIVRTKFVPTDKGLHEINEIRSKYGNDILIVGSAISAEAYRGKVLMLVLERARANIQEKIARIDKFAIR